MKKNEIKLTKKELLFRFLRANKAYIRFKSNIMKNNAYIRFKSNTMKTNAYKTYIKNGGKIGFINHCNSINVPITIANAFKWSSSPQGFKFWNDLNTEFIYYSRDYYNGK
jgi:hypothetical protein